jgi:hypothetical protein
MVRGTSKGTKDEKSDLERLIRKSRATERERRHASWICVNGAFLAYLQTVSCYTLKPSSRRKLEYEASRQEVGTMMDFLLFKISGSETQKLAPMVGTHRISRSFLHSLSVLCISVIEIYL